MEHGRPLQARLIEQVLGTSNHPDVPKARKALYELLDRADLKCCSYCEGQGGTIRQPLSMPFNPKEVFQDCEKCKGSGITTKFDKLKANHDELLKIVTKIKHCTCPRSWPRAGKHHSKCQKQIIEQRIKEAKRL